MLTRDTFIGPWAGLPVAWTDDDRFDETAYRTDVARCCQAGVPGVYSGGTTGEFYAMEFDEFKAVTRAIVEESHAQGKPAMTGCTSTYTLGAVRRAAYAAEVGADAIQVTLPYWMEIGDRQIVPFFQEVVKASGGLPLSIYETMRAKKAITVSNNTVRSRMRYPATWWSRPMAGPWDAHQKVAWPSRSSSMCLLARTISPDWAGSAQGWLQFAGLLEPAGDFAVMAASRTAGLGQRRCHMPENQQPVRIPWQDVRPKRTHRHGL